MGTNDNRQIQSLLDQYAAGAISRRAFLRGLTALGLSAPLASLLATGQASAQATPSTREPSGELTVVMPAPLVAIDPHGPQAAERPVLTATWQMFDALVVRDPASGDLAPSLATSWETDGETTWVFTLREGVTFHDGSPFTSADVKASLERLIELKGPLTPLWATVTAIETPDDLTVRITTETPLGTVPSNASLLYIAPAAQLTNQDFFDNPVGTGPFTFVSWTRDAELRLEANPDYWGGAPGIQTLIFRDIPELAARVTALETGEIDFTYTLPPSQMEALESNPDLTIDTIPSYAYYFNWFNAQREPFTDARVRQAMAYALDLDTMVNDLLQGIGARAQAPIPSTVFGFSPQDPYEYDPERAMQLLTEAGYPDGFETSVIWVPDSGPQDREIILTMISYWDAIGVRVQSMEMERATWLENLLALNWDMDFQTNSVLTGDADYTLRRLYTSSANRTGYANPELDRILLDAAAAVDPRQRLDLYDQANRIIWEDAVGIFPFDLLENYVYWTSVSNFRPAPSSIPRFNRATVSA